MALLLCHRDIIYLKSQIIFWVFDKRHVSSLILLGYSAAVYIIIEDILLDKYIFIFLEAIDSG